MLLVLLHEMCSGHTLFVWLFGGGLVLVTPSLRWCLALGASMSWPDLDLPLHYITEAGARSRQQAAIQPAAAAANQQETSKPQATNSSKMHGKQGT